MPIAPEANAASMRSLKWHVAIKLEIQLMHLPQLIPRIQHKPRHVNIAQLIIYVDLQLQQLKLFR